MAVFLSNYVFPTRYSLGATQIQGTQTRLPIWFCPVLPPGRSNQIHTVFFAAIFLSRLSFLYLLQCQLLKYMHASTYDILLGTSVLRVDQLQSIKNILSSYDLLLCYCGSKAL